MSNKLKVVDADTLLSTPLKKTLFIVGGLIPQGMHILCGASKIGKSWLMLWLCLQVAQGQPVWEMETKKCDVLYLCLEDTFTRIQNRLYTLTDDAPDNLRFAVMCGRIGNGLEAQIETFLTEYPNTRFIVIDTLQKVRDGRSEGNAYSNDYEEIGALKGIADRHEIAMIAIHHLRKLPDNGDPFNQVSGTTGITGAVDSTFVLKKASRSADTASLLVTGRDIAYQELILRFADALWQLVERKDCEELKKEAVPDFLFRLVDFMQDKPGWKGTATKLLGEMQEIDISPNGVTKMLSRFYYDVLEPNGIEYTTRRTGKSRELLLQKSDGSDTNDGKTSIEKPPSQPSPIVTAKSPGNTP